MLWKDVIRLLTATLNGVGRLHFTGLSLLIDCWPKSGSESETNKAIRRWSRTYKIILPLHNSWGPYSHWGCYRDWMHPWSEKGLAVMPSYHLQSPATVGCDLQPFVIASIFHWKISTKRCVFSIQALNLWEEMSLK